MQLDKFSFLRLILLMCTLDAFSVWLLIFFYLTGIDLMFIVNINFVAMAGVLALYAAISMRVTRVSLFFWILLFITLVKSFIYVEGDQTFGFKFVFSYYFGLILPILALNLASSFKPSEYAQVYTIFMRFSWRYVVVAFSGLAVYVVFYFIGKIAYFGMGTNLHYVFPFFLAANKMTNTVLFFIAIILSGKRAVLINFVAQNLAHYSSYLIRRPMLLSIFVLMSGGVFTAIALYTNMLYRFEVFLALDFTDKYSLMRAFSGRFEELIGIAEYFSAHPNQLLFGAPAGASYIWNVDLSDYVEAKNYAHISFFAYTFRYGLFTSISIYILLFYTLMTRWRSHEPFFLAVVGILVSSVFGANMLVDPLSWIFIGLLIYMCPKKSDQKNQLAFSTPRQAHE